MVAVAAAGRREGDMMRARQLDGGHDCRCGCGVDVCGRGMWDGRVGTADLVAVGRVDGVHAGLCDGQVHRSTARGAFGAGLQAPTTGT